jgi:hypothetical protein
VRAVESIDAREVLARVVALPISSWSYVFDEPSVRHIGPMAQDFHAAFDVGGDERRIDPLDAQGVALAAIQALHEVVEAQRREIDDLHQQLVVLERERRDG